MAKVEGAKAQLEKDHSTASWSKVAKKYSTDPTSKTAGGLEAGVTEGRFPEPLNSDVFNAPKGQLVGPVKTSLGYYLFVVEKETPKKIQPLSQAKSQISSQLTQQAQQETFTQFVSDYSSKWQSRTFCAPGYVIERCANYPGSAHPSSAPPGCYEANPKGGLPAACPAPVSTARARLAGHHHHPRAERPAAAAAPAASRPQTGLGGDDRPRRGNPRGDRGDWGDRGNRRDRRGRDRSLGRRRALASCGRAINRLRRACR